MKKLYEVIKMSAKFLKADEDKVTPETFTQVFQSFEVSGWPQIFQDTLIQA